MTLTAAAVLALAAACAPQVAAETILAIANVESARKPYVIRDNRSGRVFEHETLEEAAITGQSLMVPGHSLDLGLMQISSRNLERLGLSVSAVLDPCTNVQAGARILGENYTVAAGLYGPGQRALSAALSAYNTGSPSRGFANGYVGKYYALPRRETTKQPVINPYTASPIATPQPAAYDNSGGMP